MNSKKQGFTLIELVVVMVILGILAAIAIPAVKGYRLQAANTIIQSAVDQYRNAAMAFCAQTGNQGQAITTAGLDAYVNGSNNANVNMNGCFVGVSTSLPTCPSIALTVTIGATANAISVCGPFTTSPSVSSATLTPACTTGAAGKLCAEDGRYAYTNGV